MVIKLFNTIVYIFLAVIIGYLFDALLGIKMTGSVYSVTFYKGILGLLGVITLLFIVSSEDDIPKVLIITIGSVFFGVFFIPNIYGEFFSFSIKGHIGWANLFHLGYYYYVGVELSFIHLE